MSKMLKMPVGMEIECQYINALQPSYTGKHYYS